MFKKLIISSLAVAAGVCLATGQANAAFIQNQFFLNTLNQLSDNSAESQGVDTNGNSVLDVGDTLRGIFNIETIEDLGGGAGNNNLGANGVELSAIFEIQVASKTFTNGIDASDGFNFTFEPYSGFEATYGAGAMIALYEDSVIEFSRNVDTGATAADIATMEGLVTDGNLVMTWGIPDIGDPNFDADNFWAAFGAPEDPTDATGLPAGSEIGEFNMGLSILFNALFTQNLQVAAGCAVLPGGCAGDGFVDVNGSGGIKGTSGVASAYDVFNNVDFVLIPVPEPSTLGLLGLGLVALGFVARRRP